MAQVKNSFLKNGTEKKTPVKSFWDRLFNGVKEDNSSFWKDRVYPKNADTRMTMLTDEIANLANTLTTNKKRFKEKDYEILSVLQRALQQRAENQPSFEQCDFMGIDKRLFELCQNADESIRRGYHTAALWAMRGLSCGLIDMRQEVAQAEMSGYSTRGDAVKKVLTARERYLEKYKEIANQYFMVDKSSQELSRRKDSLGKKNADYQETYQKFEVIREEPRGKIAMKLLETDPTAAATNDDARELDDLIRCLSVKWVACEVEAALILELRYAIEALENGVSGMRAALSNSALLKDFLKESIVAMEKVQKEAHENRLQLYKNIENYQTLMNDERAWQKSFQRSEVFLAVSGNARKQLNLLQEEKEETQRVQDFIEKEVQEEQKILADERKFKAEEAMRIEEEIRKAEAEAKKAEEKAKEKAEAEKAKAEKAKAELAVRLHAQ